MENQEIIVLENLSDEELLNIVAELENSFVDEDSILRVLAKQFFGDDTLLNINLIPNKVLPVVAQRMKYYSPHINNFQQPLD